MSRGREEAVPGVVQVKAPSNTRPAVSQHSFDFQGLGVGYGGAFTQKGLSQGCRSGVCELKLYKPESYLGLSLIHI